MSQSLAQFTVEDVNKVLKVKIALIEEIIEQRIQEWKNNIRARTFKKFFLFPYIPSEEEIQRIYENEYDWQFGYYSTGRNTLTRLKNIKSRYANISPDTIIYLNVDDVNHIFNSVVKI